jgi:hypothetical protein
VVSLHFSKRQDLTHIELTYRELSRRTLSYACKSKKKIIKNKYVQMSRAHTLQLLLGVTYLKKKSTYNKIFLLCSERRKQHMQKKKKRKTLEKKCPTCFARRQIFIFACKKLYSDCHAGFVRFSFVNLPLLLLWGISMRPRRPNTG